MSLNGAEGEDPISAGIPISDTVAGAYAAFGILAALINRGKKRLKRNLGEIGLHS